MIKKSSNERNGKVQRRGLRNPLTWRSQHNFENTQKRATMVKRADLENAPQIREPLRTSPIPTSTGAHAFFRHHRGLSGCLRTGRSQAGLLSVLLFPLAALRPYLSCLSKPHPHFLLFKPSFPTNHTLFPLHLSAHPTAAEEAGVAIPVSHGSLFLSANRARGLCLARGNPLKPDRFCPQ